jgi:hypothetical protein
MQGKEEARMSLTLIIVMLIFGWLAVATAMLWGVLRITRRPPLPPVQSAPVAQTDQRVATAH